MPGVAPRHVGFASASTGSSPAWLAGWLAGWLAAGSLAVAGRVTGTVLLDAAAMIAAAVDGSTNCHRTCSLPRRPRLQRRCMCSVGSLPTSLRTLYAQLEHVGYDVIVGTCVLPVHVDPTCSRILPD